MISKYNKKQHREGSPALLKSEDFSSVLWYNFFELNRFLYADRGRLAWKCRVQNAKCKTSGGLRPHLLYSRCKATYRIQSIYRIYKINISHKQSLYIAIFTSSHLSSKKNFICTKIFFLLSRLFLMQSTIKNNTENTVCRQGTVLYADRGRLAWKCRVQNAKCKTSGGLKSTPIII